MVKRFQEKLWSVAIFSYVYVVKKVLKQETSVSVGDDTALTCPLVDIFLIFQVYINYRRYVDSVSQGPTDPSQAAVG